jgi:hypothetical protein
MAWGLTTWLAVAAIALPVAAHAQARNANVYDGKDHEPAAGPTRQDERAAGIAPTRQQDDAETRDLAVIQQHLERRAQQDATSNPTVGHDIHGHLPDGSAPITPNAGGAGRGGVAR